MATGVGSLPGTDPDEAARLVADVLDSFPHLVELPASGVGSDMIGRGAVQLADLHVELQPSGWRFAAHAGADERRARSRLARDLDALEEHTQGFAGPLKIQCAGPYTLAASLELHYGDKALADAGAVRDITGALAEGIRVMLEALARRVPGAALVVQLDEPLLPVVVLGRVPTASGFGALRAVDPIAASDGLRVVVAAIESAGAVPIAHCCAASPPIDILADAGMRAVGLDATVLTEHDDDAIGSAVENGVGLFLGLVPSLDVDPMPPMRELVEPARRLWSRLGFAPENLARDVVVTPTCGLAGASPSWPRQAYRACVEAGRVLLEEPEEGR
jgi:methionine synthase II (cobalamin-independent)